MATGAIAARGGCGRGVAAAADAGRVHRPEGQPREPARLHPRRARPRRRRWITCCCRAARPGQDHAGADRGARTGRGLPRHLRPGDPAGRGPGRDPDQSAAARRAVHRRDPPPAARDRGSPVSGDGGFPARPHHRRGAGGALACASTCRRSPWSAPPPAPGCWRRRCATASAFRCGWCSTRRRSWS